VNIGENGGPEGGPRKSNKKKQGNSATGNRLKTHCGRNWSSPWGSKPKLSLRGGVGVQSTKQGKPKQSIHDRTHLTGKRRPERPEGKGIGFKMHRNPLRDPQGTGGTWVEKKKKERKTKLFTREGPGVPGGSIGILRAKQNPFLKTRACIPIRNHPQSKRCTKEKARSEREETYNRV